VRTAVIDGEEGVAEYGVGTAITNTSDVASAYEETRLKARILVDRRPDFQLVERFRQDYGAIAGMEPKLDTLEDSARYFGYGLNRGDAVVALEKAAANGGSQEIELRVGRSGHVDVITRPAPAWCGSLQDAPILAGTVCTERVSSDNIFLFHKTTDSRLREAIERQYPDAEVVILINDAGNVAGSLQGNVAVELEGEWLMPPRSSANTVEALSRELVASGIVQEHEVTLTQLGQATRVAVIDDVEGWRLVELTG
jgi:para-aminobenzoate synthetase/4-amino-4-deoxychorismate lyase